MPKRKNGRLSEEFIRELRQIQVMMREASAEMAAAAEEYEQRRKIAQQKITAANTRLFAVISTYLKKNSNQ